MGVRVRIEIKHGNVVMGTVALVNSGYETPEPEVHIPLALARRLGLIRESLRSTQYRVVGSEVTTYVLGEVEVRIVTEDRTSPWIKARAVMVPGEYEVLISDALIEAFEIEVLKPKSGIWKFKGETKTRESPEPEYWVE
ncbi:MAG: hypothetical protein ACTSXJ_11115 [Candidatus Baldrarchaeia archaeon]